MSDKQAQALKSKTIVKRFMILIIAALATDVRCGGGRPAAPRVGVMCVGGPVVGGGRGGRPGYDAM